MFDKIDLLVGKTITKIIVDDQYQEEMKFVTVEGTLRMYHSQDCCESVSIESIVGDLNDLLNTPILVAEERSSETKPADVERDYEPESETWTFYTLRTIFGTVDIRWYGTSNGYYSESAYIEWLPV